MAHRPDRLRIRRKEITLSRDEQGHVVGRVARAHAIVEAGDMVRCPLIINDEQVGVLQWRATVQPGKNGYIYLRLIVGDECGLDNLTPPTP